MKEVVALLGQDSKLYIAVFNMNYVALFFVATAQYHLFVLAHAAYNFFSHSCGVAAKECMKTVSL